MLIATLLAPGLWTLYRWLRAPRIALGTLVVIDILTAATVANKLYWLLIR